MTTAREIITDAVREGNLRAIGEPITDAEYAESLARLNTWIRSLLGYEIGVKLQPWASPPSRTSPVAARQPLRPAVTDLPANIWPYPPANVRLKTKITAPTTVFFPNVLTTNIPTDGARMALADVGSTDTLTIDANGVLIEGAPTLTLDLTDPDNKQREWFFRADLMDWRRVQDLTLDDEVPFPGDLDDMLIAGLSIRLSPRFGQPVNPATAEAYRRWLEIAQTRYKQYQPENGNWNPLLQSKQAHPTIDYYSEEGLYR
jgi:hypothetical protein